MYKLFTHCDLDGIGCAILAYLAFGGENVDVEYCGYDDVNEKVMNLIRSDSIPYNHVYITDISISEDTAAEIDSRMSRKAISLFDHHTTPLELNEYDWCEIRIANDDGIKTSGTELFYEHLKRIGVFKSVNWDVGIRKNIEKFVEIVRDYDTWRWKKELGKEGIVCKDMNNLFGIYGKDEFIEWVLNKISGVKFPIFSKTDKALLKQKQKDIDIYIGQKNKQLRFKTDIKDRKFGIVFAEQYFSELGNRLCELHPELDYVVMIDLCNGKLSFRTIRDNINLGVEISNLFGGGGHRKAAGSTFNAEYIQALVWNTLKEIRNV